MLHGFQDQAAKKLGRDIVGAAAVVKKSKKVFNQLHFMLDKRFFI